MSRKAIRGFGALLISLTALVMFAIPSGAASWSQYYNGNTYYGDSHWSWSYESRGGAASATTMVGNTICGFKSNDMAMLGCDSDSSWWNQVTYPLQRANNMCKIYNIGWNQSSAVNLNCSKGT